MIKCNQYGKEFMVNSLNSAINLYQIQILNCDVGMIIIDDKSVLLDDLECSDSQEFKYDGVTFLFFCYFC